MAHYRKPEFAGNPRMGALVLRKGLCYTDPRKPDNLSWVVSHMAVYGSNWPIILISL
mgnify:CR=1 FL=1